MRVMKRQYKNHYQLESKRNHKVIISACVAIAVVVVGSVFTYNTLTADKTEAKNSVTTQKMRPFAYKSDGEWGHAITNGQSLALFDKHDARGMSPCFVSTNYQPGRVDVADKLKTTESLGTGGPGVIKVTKLGSKSMTMSTDEGTKHYTLDQFDVVSSDSDKLMGGMEFGYIATSKGSVKVTGNCEQSKLLSTTIGALSGISFDSTKVDMSGE